MRLLLICPQRIGDVLLATPLARAMKRAWPGAELDFLVLKGTEGVLAGNPDISRVLAFAQRTDWRGKLDQYRQIWNRYDIAAATIASDRARIYAWAAARQRVGFVTAEAKDQSKRLLLSRSLVFDDQHTHTVAMGARLCELLEIPPCYEVVPPSLNPEQWPALETKLAALSGAPYAVIHAYPKFRYKMWRTQAWVELVHRLQAAGLAVLLTGGPDADEAAYVTEIARQSGPALLNLAGRLSLAETAEVLRQARLYVGPDTAVTHIAAAAGIATVALFGPSNPVKWGPWPAERREAASPWPRTGSGRSGNVHLIQGPGDCVPCLLEGCERHVHSASRCLEEIQVETVWAAIRDFAVLDAVG